MLTNMESAASVISGLNKTLTTPFSINDILTRNNTVQQQQHQQKLQQQQQRCSNSGLQSDAESVTELTSKLRRKSSCEIIGGDDDASACYRVVGGDIASIYKLSQCNLSSSDNVSNSSPSCDLKVDTAGHAAEYLQYYAALENNNNHSDYMQRKLAYFGAGLKGGFAGNRDCPIDMRRCTNNDSGELNFLLCFQYVKIFFMVSSRYCFFMFLFSAYS